ncbi:MAG TPA: hypothetical protein VJU82_00215, partial [Acidobacteriaceae bacterium]|nr:hypothetical protein [Acidobacteriaceae bacterium]
MKPPANSTGQSGGGPDVVLRKAIRLYENGRYSLGDAEAAKQSRGYLRSCLSSDHYRERGASLARTVSSCLEGYLEIVRDDDRTVVTPDSEHRRVLVDGVTIGTGIDFLVTDTSMDCLVARIVLWSSSADSLLQNVDALALFACPAALA